MTSSTNKPEESYAHILMNTSMQERRGKLILKEDIDADGNVVNSEEHSYKNIRYAENIDFTYVPRYLVYATEHEAIYIGKEVISSSVGRRKYGTEEVKTKTDYGYNALYVPSSVTTTISGDEKHITRTTYLSNGESGINAEMYAKGFIETSVSEAEYVQYPGEDQKLVRRTSYTYLKPDADAHPDLYRIATATDYDPISGKSSVTSYKYDSFGNLVEATDPDGVLLSSAGGRPAEHDPSGALSLHPLSGARIFRNPLGGLSALEGEGGGRVLASCDADGNLVSLSDSARTSGIVRRGSFSYAIADGREALAGVPFPGGRFVRDAHGSTSVLHFVTDHLGSPRAVVRGGDVAARLDLMPSGAALSDSGLDGLPGDAARLRFAGKEDLSEPSLGLLPLLDFGARLYDPLTLAWDSPDPLADKYPSLSPYAYCAGDPVNFIDPDGKRIIIGSAFRRFMSKLGVNNYEAKVQSQIEELKNIHPEINDMISFIEDSPITIKVVHPATYHDSQGNHFVFNAFYRSDKTIMYDPENDILPSGKTRPAIIGLAHEFAHVENFLKGTEVQVNRDKARHGDKNEIEKLNEDELHSIQIENLVREVYNIPLRNETYYELPEE